jgi:hypothetical protein
VRDQVAVDATALTLGQVTSSKVVDKTSFTVTREVQWVNQDSTTGPCDGGTSSVRSARAFFHADVKVTWTKMSGVRPVHTDSIVYPKVGAFDPITGAVAVKVLGASGQPQTGYTVNLAGPTNRSQNTSADGCAFIAYVPAGAYVATVTGPGSVDLNGNSTATNASVGVSVGSITNVTVNYDRAAGLDITPTPLDAAHPAAPGLPVRLGNALLTNGVSASSCGYTYPAAAPAYPCSVRNLYPFATGDQAWAGDCLDAVPSSATVQALQPGGVTSVGTTPMAALDVTVLRSGVPVPDGTPVFMTHLVDAASTGCTAARTYKIGVTTAGRLAVSVPFGKWTISATTPQPASATAPGSVTTYAVVTLSQGAPTATPVVTG